MNFNPQRFEDFIQEESFVRWIRNPTDDSAAFWQQWCSLHPELAQEIELARQLILGIEYQTSYRLSTEELTDMFSYIKSCTTYDSTALENIQNAKE